MQGRRRVLGSLKGDLSAYLKAFTELRRSRGSYLNEGKWTVLSSILDHRYAVQTNQWLFFLQRANRKNVELVGRLAVFQMLHDTSQGIDILSIKKNLFWFFSCVLLAFRSSSDWFCHRKCLSRNWVCSACACVCASATGMCVKKFVRGVRVQRWARL